VKGIPYWREIRDGAAAAGRFATSRIERAPVLTALICAAVLLAAVTLP
jgi:hypothetical protein